MNSKTLLILLIVNYVTESYGQQSEKFFRNDYTYLEEVQSFYKIHAVSQSWADAKRICTLEQATLWHPDNDDEANAFFPFWNKNKPNIQFIFVGLSDLLFEGMFETVNGKPVTDVYNNWYSGEPNNFGGGQNCVFLDLKDKTLADKKCEEKLPFTCKKTLQSLQWNEQCDMPYLDYTFNKKNGKCYKLHTTPLNWNEANAVCRLEQSSLANVNNQRDADYLVKLTESTPTPKVKGIYQRGIYHLGFYNKFNKGWQTVGGKPMVVDLDMWWGNYQPEGEDLDQCGAMFFNGRLININCNMTSLFICEHGLENVASPVYEYTVLQPFVGGGVD